MSQSNGDLPAPWQGDKYGKEDLKSFYVNDPALISEADELKAAIRWMKEQGYIHPAMLRLLRVDAKNGIAAAVLVVGLLEQSSDAQAWPSDLEKR